MLLFTAASGLAIVFILGLGETYRKIAPETIKELSQPQPTLSKDEEETQASEINDNAATDKEA